MMLIIFGALKIELLPVIRSVHIYNIHKNGKTIIYEGFKNNRPVTIIQTGMGTKNAKMAVDYFKDNYSKYIKRNSIRPKENMEVLMIGFCGAADRSIKVGDTVIYNTIKNIEHSGKKSFVENGILDLNRWKSSGSPLTSGSVNVTGGNVPEVITDPIIKKQLYTDFNIQAIDMESYWIGKAVLEMKLPFSCIRIVSDGAQDLLPSYYGNTAGTKVAVDIILSFFRSIFSRKEFTANISAIKNLRKADLRLTEVSKTLFRQG